MSHVKSNRLHLPNSLKGEFTNILIGTYGADILFAERFIFPSLPRSVTNRVILADSSQLARSLDENSEVRGMNRMYIVAPVRSKLAHHPKYLLLTGPKHGRLLVGSGNLSFSGYTGPGESFTVYDWSEENPGDVVAFGVIRQFVATLHERNLIDDIAMRLINEQWQIAPWVPRASANSAPVIHNLMTPFLDQIDSRIAGRRVREIVAAAPFHDRKAKAVAQMLERYKPDRFTLLVQSGQTTLNVSSLQQVISSSKVNTKILDVAAPKRYSPSLLHSKFIIFHLDEDDIIFQGSANLSEVALCLSGDSANIEMGNIIESPKGGFDSLVSELQQSVIQDISDFMPAEFDTDNDDVELSMPVLEVTWRNPSLQIRIKSGIDSDGITFRVNEDEIEPTSLELIIGKASSEIVARFSEEDSFLIDQSIHLFITLPGFLEQMLYPYHLFTLLKMSSSGARIDLLREVGSLDLEDKELLELVAELDRVLIVDSRSIWRLSHSEDREVADEESTAQIKWEDLNWKLIEEHPTMRQYGELSKGGFDTTELGIVLAAVSARFRTEVKNVRSNVTLTDPGDDSNSEQEVEDEDSLGVVEFFDPDIEEESSSGGNDRIKRVWKNFIRRFMVGITDVEYVKVAGSSVIVSGYIVFNHLCRRLRILDKIDSDFLTEVQIKLWEFMWGSIDDFGYLSNLPEDERNVALGLLINHEDIAVTLAAIEDAYGDIWQDKSSVQMLRDAGRAFLASTLWKPSEPILISAAAVTKVDYVTDAETLYWDLCELLTFMKSDEKDLSIASAFGLRVSEIEWSSETIKRDGEEEEHVMLRLPDSCQISGSNVGQAINSWMESEPARTYFRIKAGKLLAIVDIENESNHLYNLASGEDIPFELPVAETTLWMSKLNALNEVA